MKLNDRVMTQHGPGVIKDIEPVYNYFRYGILHDKWPEGFSKDLFKNRILYYLREAIKEED